MKNKTVLITGSTDGIGKQTALELARMGARVLLHGRSMERCQVVRDEIYRITGNDQIEFYVADLSSLKQVRKLAASILERQDCLDVLLNNAGVYMKQRVLSEDGYEMTFAVNYLAPFLLTCLLLDIIKKSAPSRIITVSSTMAVFCRKIDFDNLNGEKSYSGHAAYALSKLCNIYFTYELAGRLDGTGVTANCLHPGVVNTKLLQVVSNSGAVSVEEGAATSVYLATSPNVEKVSGKFFENRQEKPTLNLNYNETLGRKLWEVSEELAGIHAGGQKSRI